MPGWICTNVPATGSVPSLVMIVNTVPAGGGVNPVLDGGNASVAPPRLTVPVTFSPDTVPGPELPSAGSRR